MNFHVIESRSRDQYIEFVDLYNKSDISKSEILEKLSIGQHQYNKYYKRAKRNEDIKLSKKGRPKRGLDE